MTLQLAAHTYLSIGFGRSDAWQGSLIDDLGHEPTELWFVAEFAQGMKIILPFLSIDGFKLPQVIATVGKAIYLYFQDPGFLSSMFVLFKHLFI